MIKILEKPRGAALWIISLLVLAATSVSFAESYRALYLWAIHHKLSGSWAAAWPIQIDTFIAIGELGLFVALTYGWSWRTRYPAWIVTALGLSASVAANVGHVATHDLFTRATSAVPPLTASAALAVGLGILKRVVSAYQAAQAAPEIVTTAEQVTQEVTRRAPSQPRRKVSKSRRRPTASFEDAELKFATEIEAGELPKVTAFRNEFGIGNERAHELRDHIRGIIETREAVPEIPAEPEDALSETVDVDDLYGEMKPPEMIEIQHKMHEETGPIPIHTSAGLPGAGQIPTIGTNVRRAS